MSKGAFEKTLDGIENCVSEGIYTCIATTVTKINLAQVPELIEKSRRLGVRRFIAFNFIPTGRGLHAAELDLPPRTERSLWTAGITVRR